VRQRHVEHGLEMAPGQMSASGRAFEGALRCRVSCLCGWRSAWVSSVHATTQAYARHIEIERLTYRALRSEVESIARGYGL
jgi:hypothetical protein